MVPVYKGYHFDIRFLHLKYKHLHGIFIGINLLNNINDNCNTVEIAQNPKYIIRNMYYG